jgi:hypothetical protein
MEASKRKRLRCFFLRTRRTHFGLSAAIIALSTICVVCAIIGDCRRRNDPELLRRSIMLAHPDIEDVGVDGFYEGDFLGTFTFVTVSLRIKGRPGSLIHLYCPEYDVATSRLQHLQVSRIGQMKPCCLDDSRRIAGPPDIGAHGPLRNTRLPRITCFDDIIQHYDELESYFATWPVWPKTNSRQTPDGTSIECWCEL